MDNNKLEDIDDANISPAYHLRQFLAMIRKGWSRLGKLSHKVEEAIKELGLFDYPMRLR